MKRSLVIGGVALVAAGVFAGAIFGFVILRSHGYFALDRGSDDNFETADPAPSPTTTVLPSIDDTLSPPPTQAPPATEGTVYFNDFEADDSFSTHIVHSLFHRDDELTAQPSWLGDHPVTGDGDLCGSPFEKREIGRGDRIDGFSDDWIYRCVPGGDLEKSHIMTSLGDTSGYSIGCVVPGAEGEALVFDGVTEVRWNVSQSDLGDRNFTEVAVIPAAAMPELACDRMPCNPGLPCDSTTHDELGSIGTQWGGLFNRMIHTWEMPTGYQQAVREPGYRCEDCAYSPGLNFGSGYGEGDPAITDIRIRKANYLRDNADGTITWGLQLEDGSFQDFTVPGAFPTGPVVVVFKHHTYTPLKAPPLCTNFPELDCDQSEGRLTPAATRDAGLFTWHWDDLTVIGDEIVGTIPVTIPRPVIS